MEEESWKRNPGRGILEEEPWTKNPGGGSLGEESWGRNPGRGILEGILGEAPGRLSGRHQRGFCKPRLAMGAQGASWSRNVPKPLCFTAFELATPYFVSTGREQVSESVVKTDTFARAFCGHRRYTHSPAVTHAARNPTVKHCLGNDVLCFLRCIYSANGR